MSVHPKSPLSQSWWVAHPKRSIYPFEGNRVSSTTNKEQPASGGEGGRTESIKSARGGAERGAARDHNQTLRITG